MADEVARDVRMAAIKERVLNDALLTDGVSSALTRERVEELRAAGCSRAEAGSFVADLLGAHFARIIAADFASYGDWSA